MKIASTDLALQAEHTALSRRESQETLRTWRGERPDFEQAEQPGQSVQANIAGNLRSTIARISAAAREALAAATIRPAAVPPAPTFAAPEIDTGQASAIQAATEAADNDPFLSLVKRMVEMLTGQEVHTLDIGAFSAEIHHAEISTSATAQSIQTRSETASDTASGRAGFGVEYDYHAVHEELESTRFSAQGVVRTADGHEISFQLDLAMERHYREETNISVRAGDAIRKDPLVVNFGGTAAQLASQAGQRFRFDLDGNGNNVSLPLFASGSGYLALDLNHNGRIDSGKELFGPQSGNGFTDLARLDDDGNGWIDENDANFKRLSVWTPTAEGDGKNNGKLQSLADLGIGALALAHVTTPFALRGDNNADLGVIRSSGVFLTESGKAGSLQEIDLTV